MKDYVDYGRNAQLPEEAVFELLQIIAESPDFDEEDSEIISFKRYLLDLNPDAAEKNSFKVLANDSIFDCNNLSDPLYITESGYESNFDLIESLTVGNTEESFLELWQVLKDLGPSVSEEYDSLVSVLAEFKNISPAAMARTLVQIANESKARDLKEDRLATICLKANKNSDFGALNLDSLGETNAFKQWNIGNLSKGFREVFNKLEWDKVFEALDIAPTSESSFFFADLEAFSFFWNLFEKCKPKNMSINIDMIFIEKWKNRKG